VPLELAAEAGHEETACYLREVMAEHPQEFRPAITDDPVVRKTPFGIHFMMKGPFYQDKLGTNICKVRKRRFSQVHQHKLRELGLTDPNAL